LKTKKEIETEHDMRIWVVTACKGECGSPVGYAETRDDAMTMIRRKAEDELAEYKLHWSADAEMIDTLIGMDSYHADLVDIGVYKPVAIESIRCDGYGNVK
jgi:hypothetical protein